jgi:hypothetical protein
MERSSHEPGRMHAHNAMVVAPTLIATASLYEFLPGPREATPARFVTLPEAPHPPLLVPPQPAGARAVARAPVEPRHPR